MLARIRGHLELLKLQIMTGTVPLGSLGVSMTSALAHRLEAQLGFQIHKGDRVTLYGWPVTIVEGKEAKLWITLGTLDLSEEAMKQVKNPRYCRTFHCDARGDRYCCADCWMRADCPNPCLNHPSRCGLENKEKRRTET